MAAEGVIDPYEVNTKPKKELVSRLCLTPRPSAPPRRTPIHPYPTAQVEGLAAHLLECTLTDAILDTIIGKCAPVVAHVFWGMGRLVAPTPRPRCILPHRPATSIPGSSPFTRLPTGARHLPSPGAEFSGDIHRPVLGDGAFGELAGRATKA